MSDSNILRNLEAALANGDPEQIRREVKNLSPEGRDALRAMLGDAAADRVFERARSTPRAKPAGRVIVLHGIMGSLLDSIDAEKDRDRIWIHVLHLLRGRIGELRLARDGGPADPKFQVAVAGLHATYTPMMLELARRWTVKGFAYDWRADIDRSASALAALIKDWAKDEPVHLVAHSMGGLVARRMLQKYPKVWPNGRLIMLGTPNHGSFSIPFVLTGKETLVRWLEVLDLAHNMSELLQIISTFPGVYQMMPSRLVDLGDDHVRLYDDAAWKPFPAKSDLLARADEFQKTIAPTIDRERMTYIAGFDQETPFKIKIAQPGQFQYQTTQDGDGRVPHVLGLLKDVPTYFVKEEHGDLPKNELVLAAIDELLRTGATHRLLTELPKKRSAEVPTWRAPEEIKPVEPPIALTATGLDSLASGEAQLSPVDEAALEARVLRGFVPSGKSAAPKVEAELKSVAVKARAALHVEVVWSDIASVDADVYAVGHYAGVLPSGAEAVLDRKVSGEKTVEEHFLIHTQTRKRMLRADVGDIYFFPWAEDGQKIIAIAGMGQAGSFDTAAQRKLCRALASSVMSLPNARTLATVLIGSGSLPTASALEHMIRGVVEALEDPSGPAKLHTLRITELFKDRADEILATLGRIQQTVAKKSSVQLTIGSSLALGSTGLVRTEHALAMLLASASFSERRDDLLALLNEEGGYRGALKNALEKINALGTADELERIAAAIRVSFDAPVKKNPVPTRLSFSAPDGLLRTAAITETATVAERIQKFDPKLLEELAERLTDPPKNRAESLSNFLGRLILPPDFRELFKSDRPLILELDRTMAAIPWELVAVENGDGSHTRPIALTTQVSRQLRTTYSPPPSLGRANKSLLRALVIGDPGGPEASLEKARLEAKEVVELFKAHNVEVVAMIGAPSAREKGFEPATRIAVLEKLFEGGFDIVHYAGHGDYNPAEPTLAGWVFEGGLLTAGEIHNIDQLPQLIFANACLSGQVSRSDGREERLTTLREAALLPTLADEFFKRGAPNYIGTAWKVDDEGAAFFAKTFYSVLLGDPGTRRNAETLGGAMLAARQALEVGYESLWAAYQLYGDPSSRLINEVEASAAPPPEPVARCETAAELREAILAAVSQHRWDRIVRTFDNASDAAKKDAFNVQQTALALNRRSGMNDRERAESLLVALTQNGADARTLGETFGLLGRIYKDRWAASANTVYLDKAIASYRSGFQADASAIYPAVNYITLLAQKDDAASALELESALPGVTALADKTTFIKDGDDYWVPATRLELACAARDFEPTEVLVAKMLAAKSHAQWMVETTVRNLELLKKRMTSKDERDALQTIIANLLAGAAEVIAAD